MTTNQSQTEVVSKRVELTHYCRWGIYNIIDARMGEYYRDVIETLNGTNTDVRMEAEPPAYAYDITKRKTTYTSYYIHHRMTVSVFVNTDRYLDVTVKIIRENNNTSTDEASREENFIQEIAVCGIIQDIQDHSNGLKSLEENDTRQYNDDYASYLDDLSSGADFGLN